MAEQKNYHVAIVGATGAVGQKMLETLEDRNFPIETLTLLSSKRSAGKTVRFQDKEITIQEATPESFEGVDIALFSAGGSISKQLAPEAVKRGAVVVDNTSAYRMDPNVPLVVPEVNEVDIAKHQGIIANPNCSTIQMVAALEPLRHAYGLKRVIVSTYQAVSGAGNEASDELRNQSEAFLKEETHTPEILPVKGDEHHYPIAFNALPQIDKFEENGYTFEEMKMINETKKIMHSDELHVAATCVRLPIFTSHAESVYIEIDDENVNVEELQSELANAPGLTLEDDPANQVYPTPLNAEGKRDVFVGRIRKDLDQPNGFHLWVVSDNLLKGAAWNSVQIAESIIKNEWLQKK
ncbi:aspartate-semialdehyde dehydrogenase [Pontibacillus yanchengensis]|uniref:Aspartate-semialdehyde dehydrogenase n=2 Tax=Pontibacillus yanchengensis TaxID=462910 RepID=A0ACC7VAT4_9BACI|nr:aspartate-semialdehyde dehydrogenase [Pontibacillus yanchengensis]MYL33197.1 aspartate-semialdehyde dehydrogenase [Pontibacillus yanchengensis]MYL51953.1 aspartate-semialdehyde dehydrogenase [Pontibacillus yanchengensis]